MQPDPFTIKEAQDWHNTYGTIFVIDGDAKCLIAFDDEQDEIANYPITIFDI